MCVVEQESGLKVNQPASFAVSLNGAKGVIDAKVHSPSGALEECCVTEIDQGNHRDGIQTHLNLSRLLAQKLCRTKGEFDRVDAQNSKFSCALSLPLFLFV